MLTFNLENGLQLEDRGIFLPWGATPNDLQLLAPDRFQNSPISTVFEWTNTICLGGLPVDIYVEILTGRQMRKIHLRTTDTPAFKNISKHLQKVFGFPVRRSINDYAMIESEEFLNERNSVQHYGKSEEYVEGCHRHGTYTKYELQELKQELIVRLRDDCEITQFSQQSVGINCV